jgi:hypothetical protein
VARQAATTPRLRQRKTLLLMRIRLLDLEGKSTAFLLRPASNEGRIMIVILRETGCGGRFGVVMCSRAWTNGDEAYGEVVWS